jgi:hypothetical protein
MNWLIAPCGLVVGALYSFVSAFHSSFVAGGAPVRASNFASARLQSFASSGSLGALMVIGAWPSRTISIALIVPSPDDDFNRVALAGHQFRPPPASRKRRGAAGR